MISESVPKGTIVWNAEFGFGIVKSKSPNFREDNCMIVSTDSMGVLYVPRRNLTEIETEVT